MLIGFMNKIYLYLLFFFCRIRLGFSLPLIKITARIDRAQLTKAEDRNPTITAYTLTLVWPSCSLRGQVCCTDYWQQNGVNVTVCLAEFELQKSLALDPYKKRRKNKILRSTCGRCSFSKNGNRINIRLWNRG